MIVWLVDAVGNIVLGLLGEEKRQRFDAIDVVTGIIQLIVVLIVFLT